jgi:LysR family transcriptional regulator, low CO2-responsive transcriptional regulator
VKHATLRHLLTFEAVARRLSFSLAARELDITQPTASTHVRQLEAYFGVTLVAQVGKRVVLTPAGRTMLWHAHTIIDDFRNARESVSLAEGSSDALRIGIQTHAAVYLHDALAQFKREHVYVKTQIETAESSELIASLLDGRLRFAVITDSIRHPALQGDTFTDLDLSDSPQYRFWHLIYRAGVALPESAQQFRRFVIEHGAAWIETAWRDRTTPAGTQSHASVS